MALELVLLPTQKINGVYTLYTGDQWTIISTIMNRVGGVQYPYDLTAASGVTAFFPAATGGTIPVVCAVINAQAGSIQCVVPQSVTSGVSLESNPVSWYIQANLSTGPTTVATLDYPLVINAPAFNT